VREQDLGDGRRDARGTLGPTHFTVALPVLYLDKRGRLKSTDPRQTKVGAEEKFPPLGCGAQHEH